MNEKHDIFLVSIGLPIYNAEYFLRDAITSILNQTFQNFELIVIDDGSTDNSWEIALSFKDKRIRFLKDGKNMGLAARLNQIATVAKGKYLVRMDADDIMHPERVERQLSILNQNPEIDVLGTNAYSIDANNNIQGLRVKYDFNKPKLLDVKGFIHPTIIAKTEWFLNNQYDVNVMRSQDYELWQRTFKTNVFKVYTEPLLFYREFGRDYYKKYIKGVPSKFYIAQKHKDVREVINAFIYSMKAVIYLIMNKIGLEQRLINRRSVLISSENKSHAICVLKKSIQR